MIDAMLLTLAAATAAPTPVAEAPKPDQRYCIVSMITGSILPHRECRTRKDWLARGFDPLAPK